MRIFHPLRSAPVALLWGGLSFSALGDQLYAVALTWIAVGVFGAAAGYMSALQAFLALVAVLGIGRWADRWDPRRGMVGAELAGAAVLGTVVTIWLLTGGPSAAQLVTAIVVLAIGQAVFQPALQSVLPSLVDDVDLLPAANGLLDATRRIARLLGPGLVALFSGMLPVIHFLTLDAVSFLASAAALLLIGRVRPRLPVMRRAGQQTNWSGIARGVRAMTAHPLLGYFLAVTGLLNGAWYAVLFLGVPLMIEQHGIKGAGGTGLGAYGLVLSAYGCTNLASTVLFGSRTLSPRPQFQMFAGVFLVGIGLATLGLASLAPPPWALSALVGAGALGGIGGPMQDIPLAVLRQTRLSPGDTAAGMRAHMASTNAGVLLAMLLVPSVIKLGGVVPVVLACGATYLLVGAVGLVRHAGWEESAREQPA